MKLFVQIPALNEAKTIGDVIRGIPDKIDNVDKISVVVVDDGSTDATGEIAAEAGAYVIRHEQCRGAGSAFRSGIQYATEQDADIVVTIDADGQFDPADIPKLVGPIAGGSADFVTASRFIDKAFEPKMSRVKRWGNGFMSRWVSSLTKRKFYDVSCGFRAYSKNAFMRLVLLGEFTYTHETFLSLAFAGVKIAEVPIKVRGVREHGKSRLANNLFNYGGRTAIIILKTYRDYRPMRFFSILSLALVLVGACFIAFLISVKLSTGMFTPHKWSGFVGAALWGAAFVVFFIGVVADMLDRIRAAQNELLYRVRRIERALKYDKKHTSL